MARVLYLSPSGTDIWNAHLQDVLTPWKSAETVLDIDHLADVMPEYYSANLPPDWQYMNQLLARIKRAQDDGYHAVIIGCSADPGYREAKRLYAIPVVAPLTANLHLATLMRHSVSVLSPTPPGSTKKWGWYRGIAKSAGLDAEVASWRGVPTPRVADDVQRQMSSEDPEGLRARVLECMLEPIRNGAALDVAKRAVCEDGAEAVYFSCTLWSGMLGPIADALDVPVLDAARGSLKVAEMLASVYELSLPVS